MKLSHMDYSHHQIHEIAFLYHINRSNDYSLLFIKAGWYLEWPSNMHTHDQRTFVGR